MIYATCGHIVDFEQMRPGIVRVKSTYGNHSAISLVCLCPPCLADCKAKGLVLTTEKEEQAWLAQEKPTGNVY